MKTLKESLLSDIEDTLSTGDDYDNIYKKAEKDWKKLISKIRGTPIGNFYIIYVNSIELWDILAGTNPIAAEYKKRHPSYAFEKVSLIYNIDDAFDNITAPRVASIQLSCKPGGPRSIGVLSSKFTYLDENEKLVDALDAKKGVGLQQACKILSAAFAKKFPNLDSVVNDFNDNIKYTVRL